MNEVFIQSGALSGRVVLGSVDKEKINLEEIRRFENGLIEQNGALNR
jgi:hypothetical protein